MKKTKYVLLIVGVALIIFGALIPTMFKQNNEVADRFEYNRSGEAWSYSLKISVVSQKNYEINSAVITLQNAFNEYDILNKTINSPVVSTRKDGNEYIYTFSITLTQDEFFDYTNVSKVSLNTSKGTRVAKEKEDIYFKVSWTTPVMIIVILLGIGLTIGGVATIAYEKSQKRNAEQARKELSKENPEINTNNMTDDEVLSKQAEIEHARDRETTFKIFGIEETPKERICEYCGSINDANAKKCVSCGASLKAKK